MDGAGGEAAPERLGSAPETEPGDPARECGFPGREVCLSFDLRVPSDIAPVSVSDPAPPRRF